MTWVQRKPEGEDERDLIDVFVNGKRTIAVRAYAFGQYRIQLWVDRGGRYPDIIAPEC